MKLTPLCLLIALMAFGCSSDDPASTDDAGTTATDGTDASDGTDATDSSDGTDATDGTEPVVDYPLSVNAPDTWIADMARIPRAVRMTWQQDPGSTITFQWATTDLDTDAYSPVVWITPASALDSDGALRFDPAWVTTGEGLVYYNTFNDVPVDDTQFVVWTVEVTGLDPNTEYAYRVGTWEDFDTDANAFVGASLSPQERFTTGPVTGSREPFNFVMAGDSRGGTDAIRENIERLAGYDANMWFFAGDMTNGGTPPEWDDWYDAMGPVLSRKVLMPIQGNHEIFADLYYNQVALPIGGDLLDDDLKEHAWSIDYGNIHFVGLDSNTKERVIDQLPWLDADLAQARQNPDIDWIIVLFHHAAYSASKHGSTKWVQQNFVPLFEKHDVDLVFNGHDHNYERSVRIRGDAESDDGVTYVVAGGFFSPGYGNGNEWWTVVSHHGDVGNWVHLSVDGTKLSLTAWAGTEGPDVEGATPLDTHTLTK